MFDLFNSQKAKKYVMGGIHGAGFRVHAAVLVPNYNTGSGVNDVTVASVGGVDITEAEARRLIQPRPGARRSQPRSSPTTCPRSSIS